MTGPVTLVTGASRGIGRATADRLARDGHTVVGLARTRPVDPPGPFYTVDLTDAEATAAVLEEIAATHRPTNLVNNAGFSKPQRLEDTDLATLEEVLAINVRATLQCAQACLPAMKAAGNGRIVNIASRALLGKEERSAYAAAKAGVVGFTRTWALELGRHNITVNCIAPGPIATDLFNTNHPEGSDMRARVLDGVPLGRPGKPEEIAGAVAFFVSPDAAYVTGQVLYVCGGLSVGTAPV